MQDLIIKELSEKDLDTIVLLTRQLGYDTTGASTWERLRYINNSSNDVAFGAYEQEQLLGWINICCTMRLESGAFCEIGGMVVLDNARGKGIGKRLLQKASEWSRQKNMPVLKVRSNVIRKDTHRFYLQNGFEAIKEQKVFELKLD